RHRVEGGDGLSVPQYRRGGAPRSAGGEGARAGEAARRPIPQRGNVLVVCSTKRVRRVPSLCVPAKGFSGRRSTTAGRLLSATAVKANVRTCVYIDPSAAAPRRSNQARLRIRLCLPYPEAAYSPLTGLPRARQEWQESRGW